jgi:hypothetical protein
MDIQNMLRTFCLILCAVLLQACAAPHLHVQAWLDPQVDLRSYETFEVEAVQDGDRYLRINAMLASAFDLAMQGKSFRPASGAGSADLTLRFITEVRHEEELRADEIPTQKGVYTKYRMVAVNEGSLLVNIIDVKQNKVIWKGSTIRDINNLKVSKLTQERINDRVLELLASFPER